MKKDCAYTGELLRKYLRGHVFRPQKNRVERHLESCVLCRSEFEALKRKEETRQFLREISPETGILSRFKKGFSRVVARVAKLVYRPLWIAVLVLLAGAVYYYAVTPTPLDVELESIVKTAPSGTESTAAASTPVVISAPAATAPAPVAEPLMVTITLAPEKERTAIRRINEAMRNFIQLRSNKFSADVREITGALTPDELLTFLTRIKPTGKLSYNRSRVDAHPETQQLSFILMLKRAPETAKKPAAPAKSVKSRATATATEPVPVSASPAPAPADTAPR